MPVQCRTVITAQPVRPLLTSPSASWIQHPFSAPALRRAVYSTRCLSKGLGAGVALCCTAKTNTDLFSLAGKTMVNSAEWNQLGDFFCFLLFLLLCKCSCSCASLSCGIFCDIKYKSEQTVLFLIWWMMENIEITDPLFFMTFLFLFVFLCRRRWLLFASMFADRAVVLQYADFHRGNPIMVTASMWLFQRGRIQHVQNQWEFGLTRISLFQKLCSYSKDDTKLKFSCSCFKGRNL